MERILSSQSGDCLFWPFDWPIETISPDNSPSPANPGDDRGLSGKEIDAFGASRVLYPLEG
jgi:hypothetical protein